MDLFRPSLGRLQAFYLGCLCQLRRKTVIGGPVELTPVALHDLDPGFKHLGTCQNVADADQEPTEYGLAVTAAAAMPGSAAKLYRVHVGRQGIEQWQNRVAIFKSCLMRRMIYADTRAVLVPELSPVRFTGDHRADVIGVADHRVGIKSFDAQSLGKQIIAVFLGAGIILPILAVKIEVENIAVFVDSPDGLFYVVDSVFRDLNGHLLESVERDLFVAVRRDGYVSHVFGKRQAGQETSPVRLQSQERC